MTQKPDVRVGNATVLWNCHLLPQKFLLPGGPLLPSNMGLCGLWLLYTGWGGPRSKTTCLHCLTNWRHVNGALACSPSIMHYRSNWVTRSDHAKGIGPTRPMCNWRTLTALSNPSPPAECARVAKVCAPDGFGVPRIWRRHVHTSSWRLAKDSVSSGSERAARNWPWQNRTWRARGKLTVDRSHMGFAGKAPAVQWTSFPRNAERMPRGQWEFSPLCEPRACGRCHRRQSLTHLRLVSGGPSLITSKMSWGTCLTANKLTTCVRKLENWKEMVRSHAGRPDGLSSSR